MEKKERKLPVGIQSFEKIRKNDNLYVDKTDYIYQLARTNVPYFLSRPRRFGKSLLLSTMKAYWEGKEELFSGLEIEKLERNNPDAWKAYPVLYLDFNQDYYDGIGVLEGILQDHLVDWESQYAVKPVEGQTLEARFKRVITDAAKQSGRKCVVLVDEYDKPLLETLGNRDLTEHNKQVLRRFFSILTSEDANIQFVFITGVTRVDHGYIFSDLDQLRDISMDQNYAEICGITEQEMREAFVPEIGRLADEQELTFEETLAKLKQEYDGYYFHQKGKVYTIHLVC